jgi:hypothetical protein
MNNIDEVDFLDQETDSPAFMHLKKSVSGGISIGFAILKSGDLYMSVSTEDARELGERLIVAANEVAAEV